MKIIHGTRIGKSGKLALICSAVVLDKTKSKVLMTRRADNGKWCLPGGHMEPGEDAMEACAREVLEETGAIVTIGRLIGVYTNPNRVVEYADGNKFQPVVMCFEATIIGGELDTSDESTDYGFYDLSEMRQMDTLDSTIERVTDAFTKNSITIVK